MWNWKPATAGEALFLFLCKEIFAIQKVTDTKQLSILQTGGRSEDFASYFEALTVTNTFSRLIKKAQQIQKSDCATSDQQLKTYIKQQLEISHSDRSIANRLIALTWSAQKASHKPIPMSVRKAVIDNRALVTCYICGTTLSPNSTTDDSKVQYEHIWPSSYGGDSIEENLLPSCFSCNQQKGDLILWQTAHITSFCLKPDPSEEEMKDVRRREKIAVYLRKLATHASAKNITLKRSAKELGPAELSLQESIDREDARDFFNLRLGA